MRQLREKGWGPVERWVKTERAEREKEQRVGEKALFGSKTHLIGHVLLILFVGISTTRIA